MGSLKGKSILFADDSVYAMLSTVDALRVLGARVDVVTDGAEALEYMRTHRNDPPDLLILDIMMPEGKGAEIKTLDGGRSTGVEIYKWMQREKLGIPTVVSTIVCDDSILEVFRRDKKIAIVQKPYHFRDLENQILKVLTLREN